MNCRPTKLLYHYGTMPLTQRSGIRLLLSLLRKKGRNPSGLNLRGCMWNVTCIAGFRKLWGSGEAMGFIIECFQVKFLRGQFFCLKTKRKIIWRIYYVVEKVYTISICITKSDWNQILWSTPKDPFFLCSNLWEKTKGSGFNRIDALLWLLIID